MRVLSNAVRPVLLIVAAMLGGPARAQDDASQFLGDRMPYRLFDTLPLERVVIDGAVLRVGFAPGKTKLSRQSLLGWVRRSASAVARYYGRYPVADARILIVPVAGDGVPHGQAFNHRGAAIRIKVGVDADEKALAEDWIMVHEMIHFALPKVDVRHNWLAEGLAVYVESIARVQTGDLSEAQIWRDFTRAMPKGLPRSGDQGLDNTSAWGRTYWGGALFCLEADVELRRRTDNRIGLQQALRGLVAKTNFESFWPARQALATADAATGETVLIELYDRMRDKPVAPDLSALFRDLGVVAGGGAVTLRDDAPLAAVRRAIVSAPAPPS